VGIYLEPVLISIPSGLAGFILLAFYLAVYRDKTRKMEDKDVDIFESPESLFEYGPSMLLISGFCILR